MVRTSLFLFDFFAFRIRLISKCLAFHTYSPVYIPTEVDDAVKEYIRMRDDANSALARVKQQIIAFCIRHGKIHDGKSYWTNKHLSGSQV